MSATENKYYLKCVGNTYIIYIILTDTGEGDVSDTYCTK